MTALTPAFTRANRYLFDPCAYAWSLPSGYTCPGAHACLAVAHRKTGKLRNGRHQQFKCYSAVYERFPSVRGRAWANYESVRGRTAEEVAAVLECLPQRARRVRVHPGGDFFCQAYFDGWLSFAASRPQTHFWAFTKSLTFWLKRRQQVPANFVLNASYGGKHDALIDLHGLKSARVVRDVTEAQSRGLLIDRDDRLAAYGAQSFALLNNFGSDKRRIA